MAEVSVLTPRDLCVPIYLNQELVFGLLATLEDGFSHLKTIRTAASESESKGSKVGGGLGVSNVFGLLSVAIGGGKRKESSSAEQTEVEAEKVHTPISLFASLRAILQQNGLLTDLQDITEPVGIETGSLVEFEAVLRKNPVVDVIESVLRIGEMAVSFSNPHQKGDKSDKNMIRQLQSMLDSLKHAESLEIVAELDCAADARAVLSTKLAFFSDANAYEITDGRFRVLGKVVRTVASEEDEPINLLRKTPFGHFKRELVEKLFEGFAGEDTVGLDLPEVQVEVTAPALQVIPIAIFA